jgi:hypothetical protein
MKDVVAVAVAVVELDKLDQFGPGLYEVVVIVQVVVKHVSYVDFSSPLRVRLGPLRPDSLSFTA